MQRMQASDAPALLIRRTFAAPRARVFAAWAQAELLGQWFGPPGVTVTGTQCDAREGGRYRIAMRSEDGEEFVVSGIFTEVRRPERLAFTFRWVWDDPADERDTFVSIDFIERGAQTEMVFRHEGFLDEASRLRHETGWCGSFENLVNTLAN